MPSRDTGPNRINFSNNDHRDIALRTSGTVGGEGIRSVARRRCARCSSRIVTVGYGGRQARFLTPSEFQIVLAPHRTYHTELTMFAYFSAVLSGEGFAVNPGLAPYCFLQPFSCGELFACSYNSPCSHRQASSTSILNWQTTWIRSNVDMGASAMP